MLCINVAEKFEELERDGFSGERKIDRTKGNLKS
jgi:hypothetical protein